VTCRAAHSVYALPLQYHSTGNRMYSFFEKLINPFPKPSQQTPPKSLIAFCLYYTKGIKRYFLLMAMLTVVIALMEVSLFGFLGELVNWLGTKSPENLLSESGTTLIIFGALVLVIMPLTMYLHSMLIHQTIFGNFPMLIRWLAHNYLLGQSVGYYHNEFAGRLATKVMQTALAVRDTVAKLLDVMLYVVVYFSGILLLIASLDPWLAVPFIVWIIAYITVLKIMLPKLSCVSSRQADARSSMTGRIVDTYTNISTVKLFSHSDRESTYAKNGMKQFLTTVHPQMRLATTLSACVWMCNALLTFSVGALSIYLWIHQGITAGAITAAIAVVLRLHGMSQWIMWEVSALFENIGTVRDGIKTLTQYREVQDKANATELNFTQGAIHFNNVTFNYGQQKNIIDNFSLDIKPGEKIGLIGRSGAGKSTLVNLLLRFYDIDAGEIMIDGQNIASVKQDSLRKYIGMVSQDTSLLHRTVRENLCYGRPDASDEQIQQATLKAAAHDFIMTLEDNNGNTGYDAEVGERGVKLSGGQRQRLAIARVLLKDAPILILDEATSALDSEVEQAIQENLRTLMGDKTVIAIAHRLSTIAALDRLIVIDEGRIIEQGTHQQLLTQNGVYAKLWQHQSGGFLAEDV